MAVVVNGSPTRRNNYLEIQKGAEQIAVTLILDVKTRWNSTLAMLERAYRLKTYTYRWLIQYPQYKSLFTTEEEWRAVEYVLQVLLPFRYWTLWMSKRRTITLHRVIVIYNHMFDHMDSVLKALSKKKIQWKRDIHRAVRCARTKLRKYYAKVTPETGLILILATMLDPFTKGQIFEGWDKEMGVGSGDQTSYSRQYSDAFLDYWEKQYVDIDMAKIGKAKDVERQPIPRTEKSIRRIYLLDSSDEEDDCQIQETIQCTPRTSSRKSHLMQQARQYLANVPVNIQSLQPEPLEVQDDLMSNDPEEITASFWYPDVGGWWLKQETSMGEYRDLAKMARDIFSVMPHGVGVESSFCLGRDVIGWRQCRTTGVTLQQKVVVRQWARNNGGLLPDEVKMSMDSMADPEEKAKEEDKKLDRLATIKDFLTFSNESKKKRSMQKKLKGKDTAVSGMGYISDLEEQNTAEWSDFDDDGDSAFARLNPGLDKRPTNQVGGTGTTRFCFGNLVGKVRRVDQALIPNENPDPALSESEALWLLSDSEREEEQDVEAWGNIAESENNNMEGIFEGNGDSGGEEEVSPEHGLLIPGFQKVVRRSTRLEIRKRIRTSSQPEGRKEAEVAISKRRR